MWSLMSTIIEVLINATPLISLLSSQESQHFPIRQCPPHYVTELLKMIFFNDLSFSFESRNKFIAIQVLGQEVLCGSK